MIYTKDFAETTVNENKRIVVVRREDIVHAGELSRETSFGNDVLKPEDTHVSGLL